MPIRGSPNGVHRACAQPCCPGRHRPEQAVVIDRKWWSPSIGNPGRHAPERAPDDLPAACTQSSPCNRGGCYACSTAFQTWFVGAARKLFSREVKEPLTILSIVLPLRIRVGTSTDHARKQVGRLLAQIPDLLDGLTFAVGGIDVSANEAPGKATFYQYQLWIFVRTSEWQAQGAAIRKRFKPSRRVRRPIVAKTYDGRREALAYAIKPDFTRRVTVPASEGKRQNTRNRGLRVEQKVELGQLLDALGLERRLVLIGVSIEDTIKGKRRLVLDAAS